MRVETISYEQGKGWSAAFPKLDSDDTLVLVFAAPELGSETARFRELVDAYPLAKLIGCSTSGEIYGAELLDRSISVAVCRFDRSRLRLTCASVPCTENSRAAGVSIANALAAPDLRAVLVLSEGVSVNGTTLTDGLRSSLPPSVIVTGGLAGDGPRFHETWVLVGGTPTRSTVSAVGIYGEHVNIGFGCGGGWDIFGPERLVTRSDGNRLYELDGEPALALYKRYLGDRAGGLPATGLLFPLALRAHANQAESLVRTIVGVDEKENALIFAGDIPNGWRAQLMKANLDRLVDGADDAAKLTRPRDQGSGERLCVAISCVGRRLVLGERTEEELEAVIEALPAGTKQVGFYSYGEISPIGALGCGLHNQTMTLTTFSEA